MYLTIKHIASGYYPALTSAASGWVTDSSTKLYPIQHATLTTDSTTSVSEVRYTASSIEQLGSAFTSSTLAMFTSTSAAICYFMNNCRKFGINLTTNKVELMYFSVNASKASGATIVNTDVTHYIPSLKSDSGWDCEITSCMNISGGSLASGVQLMSAAITGATTLNNYNNSILVQSGAVIGLSRTVALTCTVGSSELTYARYYYITIRPALVAGKDVIASSYRTNCDGVVIPEALDRANTVEYIGNL